MVFSDSHGYMDHMIAAVRNGQPDMVIHLGDCLRDGQQLKAEFPELVIEQVPGEL